MNFSDTKKKEKTGMKSTLTLKVSVLDIKNILSLYQLKMENKIH